VEEHIALAADVHSPSEARAWVASRCGSDPDTIFAAELLVSELVSNAVIHAKSDMVLSLSHDPGSLHVEVEDHGADRPVVHTRTGPCDPIFGRGLDIVSALASSWGVRPTSGGKAVWFELPIG
jgi:anti-sigma regulatory factor (Ser/Thr protein kinase)